MKDKEGNTVALPFLSVESLSRLLHLDDEEKKDVERVSRLYPLRVPSFYAGLMEADNPRCALRLQAIPSVEELNGQGVVDPLGESGIAITPSFFKRYPKRGVFLVTAECAMYCRFCNRRRLVGRGFKPQASREETLTYLECSKEITEVILSGGDPLMLEPEELDYILARLRRMRHLRVIRISSRMPVVFPERLRAHAITIGKYAPLWFIVHVNHPAEISPEFVDAATELRARGASMVSQSVLLRGINDCPHILERLFENLVELGIKPYYLFQLDDVIGTTRFKVRIETGLSIMRSLRTQVSGLCIPCYALDITGGLGKIPLEGGYVKQRDGDRVHMENLYGQEGLYLDNGGESTCLGCDVCRT